MKATKIGWASAFLHVLDAFFVVGVVAHLAHPGLGEEPWGIPEEADGHGGGGGDENGEQVEIVHVHGWSSLDQSEGASDVPDIVFGICWNANKEKIER
jgi:hypothetical protein